MACHEPLSQHLSQWPLTTAALMAAPFAGTKEAVETSSSPALELGSFLAMRGKPLSQVSLLLKGMAFLCIY